MAPVTYACPTRVTTASSLSSAIVHPIAPVSRRNADVGQDHSGSAVDALELDTDFGRRRVPFRHPR